MSRLFGFLLVLVGLLYPALIYYGLQQFSVQTIGMSLLLLAVIRVLLKRDSASLLLAGGAALAALISLISHSDIGVKSYPIVINLCFSGLFAYSLIKPPTAIERIARLQEPDLPESGVIYTRKVTQLWLLFFLVNASIAGWTLGQSQEIWALYNGLISYLFMGCLFTLEYLFRLRHKKRHAS